MQNTAKGDALAILSIFFWASFPVALTLSYASLPALWIGAISMALSTVFFSILIILRRRSLWLPNRACVKHLAVATLMNGICYYALSFIAYRYTSTGNGAVLSLMEVFFSYAILSLLLRHEHMGLRQVLGSVLMVVGALVLLVPQYGGFHVGDIIVLVSAALPPIGNRAMQLMRREVSSEVIMFWRSLLGASFIFLFAFAFETTPTLQDVRQSLWPILFNGILVLGFSKILWVDSVLYIPVTRAISYLALQPLFTMALAWIFLAERVTLLQLLSLPPLAAGLLILVRAKAKVSEESL